MPKDMILVIGAGGQIGVDLTLALRKYYGAAQVFAGDVKPEPHWLKDTGPYMYIDATNGYLLRDVVRHKKITQIYLLAAMLSATGEQQPMNAWKLNMQSLLEVLEIAREEKVQKVFWPSSIAVFGPSAPRVNCPQHTVIEPSTVYGISKYAGESWCNYYHQRFGVDVRSLRYPGLISYRSAPGGGTTDYAVDIFHKALMRKQYTCFLKSNTVLPMMYMTDAIRATIKLMEVPADKISTRYSYNVAGFSLAPEDLAGEIQKHIPEFTIDYNPDSRQLIAESWPESIDDSIAQSDWGWKPKYDLERMTAHMIEELKDAMTAAAV